MIKISTPTGSYNREIFKTEIDFYEGLKYQLLNRFLLRIKILASTGSHNREIFKTEMGFYQVLKY